MLHMTVKREYRTRNPQNAYAYVNANYRPSGLQTSPNADMINNVFPTILIGGLLFLLADIEAFSKRDTGIILDHPRQVASFLGKTTW